MNIAVLLFFLFVVKHFAVDFPMQSYKMVSEKGTYGATGGLMHSGLHGLATMLLLLPFTSLALAFGLVDFFIHYHVDWAKMNLSKKYSFQDPMFWTLLGFDQMLHYLTYVMIVYAVV